MKKFLILAIFALICSAALAQTSSGEIRGRVADPSDAVVSGAQVLLTNQATGDTRSSVTNQQGEFVFVALQPGTFSVKATAQGYKAYTKTGLVLSASDRLSAGTLKLELGAVSESISVQAEATPVQTESAERSAQLDLKDMKSLTSLTRDPLPLLRILPGVVQTGNGANNLATASAGTIAGVRESSNAVSIDGVSGNPRGGGNRLDTPVNMDAVQEVKVVLNSYQAEYGQSAGAIVNMTTKSGTRDFHGNAYYYGRNDALNANSWLNNWSDTPRGVYRFNTVGWNVGGPIYVPNKFNSAKDKLFFFFSQERWPSKTNGGYQKFMMPTAAERNGDFSNTYDTKGQKVYVADPLLIAQGKKCSASDQSGCFPNNTIPADRINQNMQKIMNIFPLPTFNCTPKGTGGGAACPLIKVTSGNSYNYQIMAPKQEPSDQTLLRLDYNLNSQWKMYFRGMKTNRKNEGLTSTQNKLNWGIPSYYKTPNQNAGLNITYIASSTLVNEFTVGYAKWDEDQGFANASDLNKLSKSSLGLNLGQNNPSQNPLNLVPRIAGLGSATGTGTFALSESPVINFDDRFPMSNSTGTWEFTDGLTKIWNNHTAKAGIYVQAGRYIQRHLGSVFDGSFNFGANNSSPYDTQFAYSNMLLGSYSSYQEGINPVNNAPHWKVLEWYLQDTWKVKSNVTINYGVRFTYDLPSTLQPGGGATFVPERYDSKQAPALYRPLLYSDPRLTAQNKTDCKGSYKTTPSRCAWDKDTGKTMPDTFIGTFVSPFNYTGTVLNTDRSYPASQRWGNGLLPAPRFGISWDPFKDGKTAVRFGTGLYYNSREGSDTLGDYSKIAPLALSPSIGFGQLNGSNFQPGCGANNSCYAAGALVNATPSDTRILQPHRAVESTLGVNFGVQRNVGFSTVLDVAYVGTFGRHLTQQVNLNATPYGAQFNPNYNPNDPKSSIWNQDWLDLSQTGSQTCYFFDHTANKGGLYCQSKLLGANYFRQYPGYGNVNLRDYGSTSNYNSLQATVNHRFSHGVQFGGSYTWSKAMTYMDTDDGSIANFQDRRFWNYGAASFDHTQNFVFHWMANVPKASTLWNNRVLKAIGDNWEWSGIAQFMTGAPLSVDMSGVPNITGGGDGVRPFLFGDPYASKSDIHKTVQYLSKDGWALPCSPGLSDALKASTGCVNVAYPYVPSASTPGITRVNIGTGPGINNWDMSLQKNIPVNERMRFTIRAEAYNIFNHPSFSGVDTTLAFDTSNTCTGAALLDKNCGSGKLKTDTTFGQINAERGARILQLSARFTF